MLSWRSLAHRSTGWLALFFFAAGLSAPIIARQHNGVDDDVACNEPSLTIGHPVMQFEAVRPAPLTDHCAICHWYRALRHTSVASPSPFSLSETARVIAPSSDVRRASSIPHAQHGRAPPQVLA